MKAPQIAGVEQGPGHDATRANQLIEAGLWLRLGGDEEGAQHLFRRAQAYEPSNRRARECLMQGTAARPRAPGAGVPPPPPLVVTPPGLEVSMVLLEERRITDDVLAFLSGSEPAAPQPPAFQPPPPVQPPPGVTLLLQGVDELLALGDAPSATELLRRAEEFSPEDSRLAAARERFARKQQAELEEKLGDLKRVPRVRLSPRALMRLRLDAREGFVLSRIDGRLSCEALFSVSGMSRLETMRVLAQLLDQDVIALS